MGVVVCFEPATPTSPANCYKIHACSGACDGSQDCELDLMHPNLAPHLHTECRDVIEKLSSCHSQHPYKKFLGACNDLKRALNKCLQQEYETKRRKNYQESVERKKRYQLKVQERDSN